MFWRNVASEDGRWFQGRYRRDTVLSTKKMVDEAVNLTSELHDPNARVNHLCKKERKRPSREHRCGAGQIPSEC